MMRAYDYMVVAWRYWWTGMRATVTHGPIVRAHEVRDAAIHMVIHEAFALARSRSGVIPALRRRNVYRLRVLLQFITQTLVRRANRARNDNAEAV